MLSVVFDRPVISFAVLLFHDGDRRFIIDLCHEPVEGREGRFPLMLLHRALPPFVAAPLRHHAFSMSAFDLIQSSRHDPVFGSASSQ